MRWLPGGRSMLLRMVKGSEWSEFLDYLSPSLLDVLPISALISKGQQLTTNALGGARFRELRSVTEATLRARGVQIRLVENPPQRTRHVGELDPGRRRDLGQRALEIYFAQIFGSDTAILDLRASRFHFDDDADEPQWFPRSMYLAWDAEFLAALRDLYLGFYREDRARFDAALAQLDLGPAGDVLLGHFGQGDLRRVRFTTRVFHSTFHAAFLRCRDAGVTLRPDFLTLGAYLACLYDLLETLDLEFDVRAAFDHVAPA